MNEKEVRVLWDYLHGLAPSANTKAIEVAFAAGALMAARFPDQASRSMWAITVLHREQVSHLNTLIQAEDTPE